MKKVIYIINLVALLITLAAYFTIFGGMFCQPFLGIIQLVSVFIFTARWSLLATQSRALIRTYWIVVGAYGLGWLAYFMAEEMLGIHLHIDDWIGIGYAFVLPMLIAIFQVWVLFRVWKNQDKPEMVSNTIDEEFIVR